MPRTSSKRLFRVISITSVAVIVFAFVGVSKELIGRYQLQKDIRSAQEEIASLEKQNQEFSYLVDYLHTDSFKEIQARQNLGLQKEGETAAIVEEGDAARSSGQTLGFSPGSPDVSAPSLEASAGELAGGTGSSSNMVSWWDYFFRIHPETD